jgi:hypothetical protein
MNVSTFNSNVLCGGVDVVGFCDLWGVIDATLRCMRAGCSVLRAYLTVVVAYMVVLLCGWCVVYCVVLRGAAWC